MSDVGFRFNAVTVHHNNSKDEARGGQMRTGLQHQPGLVGWDISKGSWETGEFGNGAFGPV